MRGHTQLSRTGFGSRERVAGLGGCPVAIGEHTIVIHLEPWRYKDVVDAALGLGIGVKAHKCAVLGHAQTCLSIAVVEQSTVGKDAIHLVVLVHVEVTGEHHGGSMRNGAYALHHQFGSLAPCHHAHVIHVQVEEIEHKCPAPELRPRAHAPAHGIPAHAHLVGCFAEPEGALAQQVQTVLFVEDARIFPLLLAVVASTPGNAIAVEGGEHVDQLRMSDLLRAKGIGLDEVHQVAHHAAARVPHLSLGLVAIVEQPHIVAANGERLRQGCTHHQQL